MCTAYWHAPCLRLAKLRLIIGPEEHPEDLGGYPPYPPRPGSLSNALRARRADGRRRALTRASCEAILRRQGPDLSTRPMVRP